MTTDQEVEEIMAVIDEVAEEECLRCERRAVKIIAKGIVAHINRKKSDLRIEEIKNYI